MPFPFSVKQTASCHQRCTMDVQMSSGVQNMRWACDTCNELRSTRARCHAPTNPVARLEHHGANTLLNEAFGGRKSCGSSTNDDNVCLIQGGIRLDVDDEDVVH